MITNAFVPVLLLFIIIMLWLGHKSICEYFDVDYLENITKHVKTWKMFVNFRTFKQFRKNSYY